ncbi:MAG: hypothetical protein ACRDOV_05230, partial [Streptomyces sp.]
MGYVTEVEAPAASPAPGTGFGVDPGPVAADPASAPEDSGPGPLGRAAARALAVARRPYWQRPDPA